MLVAKQKRKENIAEYILYLYQVENLIRAFRLDMQLIEDHLVQQYDADEKTKNDIKAWYKNLVLMMQKEGVEKKGHLQFLANLISELNEFHLRLMQTGVDKMYTSTYQAVSGIVNELRQKNASSVNVVQVALDGIYGYLLLKIQNKPVTEETEAAVQRLSQWLGYLSKNYKDFESGDLEL